MVARIRKTFHAEVKLYNIKIIKTYIDYLKNYYPQVDIDEILKYAGFSRFQLNDLGCWYTQHQANRFHEIVVQKTGNKDISRDTGRYLIVSQNIIANYILGFKNPSSALKHIAAIYSKLSKAVRVSVKELGNNNFEFIVMPNHGVVEEQFQCVNRIGSLEGVYKFFTNEFLKIDHPVCIHKGGEFCKYIVSLGKESKHYKLLSFRNYSVIFGTTASAISYIFFPFPVFLSVFLLTVSAIFFLTITLLKLEKNKLTQNVKELGLTAEKLLDELTIRYNVTKLVQEVGEITSVVQSEEQIVSAVSKVMEQYLCYERGAIFLAEEGSNKLRFVNGYGFKKKELDDISKLQTCVDDNNSEYIIQKVFNSQEPYLTDDLRRDALTLRIYKKCELDIQNIKFLICVPILNEGKSLGVIMVDSLRFQREFGESDINLLMAVASQTALSIVHARAFKKLLDSEKKHRTLVETIKDIVYTIDLQGRFTYISPNIEKITGFAPKELIGNHFVSILAPEDREKTQHDFAENLKKQNTATLEIKIVTRHGREIPMEINTTMLYGAHREPSGRIGVARDITRRFQEEARRKEIEVRALTQDKLASLGEIATGVAHEINQPLSYIKIILQTTLSDLSRGELSSEGIKEDFQESLRQVERIAKIISHLRTFGRSDVTALGPVSLTAVIHDTLILMRERLRINNIDLQMEISDSFPMVYGNHVKLEQVFINLIQNSMDALLEQGSGDIILRAREENDSALIFFSDSGPGVEPIYREKIFEPFFTTKEAGKGTGIGLSIVYGIIQEHNGDISCSSGEGNGAAFTIRLPLYMDQGCYSRSVH